MSGTLFIVSAPSGAGKTTLVRALLARDAQVKLSISYTTRPPRAGEQDGRDYHFISVAEFTAMRARGDFLESAEVHGNFYATSRIWLEREMAAGRDVLLEIDWQGAQQVRKFFHDAVGIFILPPSMTELERRLRGRGTDDEATITRRLQAALAEMRHVVEFEYAIINQELEESTSDLVAAVHAARLRLAPQQARYPELFTLISQE
ncbi:MAG: guanylate kinase [Betaproteobacteria bacterium]|nr:guanylate kinase [Betaproteobacteria bacterium]